MRLVAIIGRSKERMDSDTERAVEAFQRLYEILKRLRGPEGCPWDRKQTQKSMAPLILEEAYEVAEAIEEGGGDAVAEELGDLSMNFLMTCLIASEAGAFETSVVLHKIAEKLVQRHPHVFGGEGPMEEERFLRRWEDIKKSERRSKNKDASVLAGVPKAMPALLRALRMVEKLKRTDADLPVLRKPLERASALLEAFDEAGAGQRSEEDAETIGRLFLCLTVACSDRKINPEMALQAALGRLERTFRCAEAELGDRLGRVEGKEWDRIWARTKQQMPDEDASR
jgi:MazG family protein